MTKNVVKLTHGHGLVSISAIMLVCIIHQIIYSNEGCLYNIGDVVKSKVMEIYKESYHIDIFIALIDKVIIFSQENHNNLDVIHSIENVCNAKETLAISLHCSLKYQNNFEKAVITSVNHDGDSDTTGLLTGNIVRALLGLDKIPRKLVETLELKNVILEVSEDLYKDSFDSNLKSYFDEKWKEKYITFTY